MTEDEMVDLVDQIANLVAEFEAETKDWPTISERVQNELNAREEMVG